jgi:Hemerythrin HHE cation binding domain
MNRPLHQFFSDDHRRLDALLRRSIAEPCRIELESFGKFRAGILKHIGMEEKVLFPAARRARSGEPLPVAAKLRVDHGAIAALLVPSPTAAVLERLLSVLVPHNRREEEPDGIYDACDMALTATESARLIEELVRFPEVALNPYNDAPAVLKHIETALEQSRRQWSEIG